MVDSEELLVHTETEDSSAAAVTVDAAARADYNVEPKLYGKFCEHLGNNVYQGMEAEILFNPTFAEWHFRTADHQPSGGYGSVHDRDRVEAQARGHGKPAEYRQPFAYPDETDVDAMMAAYEDGLAFGWQLLGDVRPSPDTDSNGNRAQRIQVDNAGDGIVQETRLPLHRTDDYEFRTRVRATQPTNARVSVRSEETVHAEASIEVGRDWDIVEGSLELPEGLPDDDVYDIVLIADDPTDLVVERLLLYPGDHVNYADPDVIEFLRASDLPLLRWPGGNFVSGYDWRDGVGPVDDRPERPNPAWGGVDPNLFGTAEFVEFCEAVGCEPSICVNAGDGTPEEAAKWVEYCNGDPEETEMGALRAAHGYEEPFGITYWEVGNELFGSWQVRWTTPRGNADRYERFREAMLDADPDIELTACGSVANEERPWNDVLLEECGSDVRAISSHPLVGGRVDADTDPDELYHAFMGYPAQLADQYAALEDRMREAGVTDPKLDVTELQLFATFDDANEDRSGGDRATKHSLTPETMPDSTTISEAIYDACVRHELIRLGDFSRMLTHSATVNHGGGLQKKGERVWADPCHYGRAIGTVQAGAVPVAVELECTTVSTGTTFGAIDPVEVPAVDAMATVDDDAVRVVLVNRTCRSESITVSLDIEGAAHANEATVTKLGSDELYHENTRELPDRVTPVVETVYYQDEATIELSSYTMARIDIPAE